MKKQKPARLPWWLRSIIYLAVVPIGLVAAVLINDARPEDSRPLPGVRVSVENGHGSGVHIGNGFIVTAAHVVGEAKTADIKAEDGQTFTATVLWSNKDYDVALVRVEAKSAIQSRPLSCKDPAAGTLIQTTGNPLNLEFIRTWGHVGSVVAKRGPWLRTFIADITVAGGVSGGPVYDMQQRIVGIVVGTAVQPLGLSGSFIALTYVVPASAICSLLAR